MYKRILVALDGTGTGEQALSHAATLAHAFRSELVLLHVLAGGVLVPDIPGVQGADGVPGPTAADRSSILSERAEAEAYLETIANRLRATGLEVSIRVIAGPIARSIAEEAIAVNADLLLLAAQGRSGIARLVAGSIPEDLIRLAPCPVVLVPTTPQPHDDGLPVVSSGQVRSFEADARAMGAVAPKPLGLRMIDVNRVVGSVGRARELNADFRPHGRARRRSDEQRFANIMAAIEAGLSLPPIDVYKLGYHYYVLDGNHRVAAAKARHQADIEAIVTEFLPICDEESAEVFAERRQFERATGLTRIGATRVGHYPAIASLIREFAEDLTEREASLGGLSGNPLYAAASRWQFEVYTPISKALKDAKVARCFPSERTADVFVHLATYRQELAERTGSQVTWKDALERFIQHYAGCSGSTWQRIPGIRFLFRPRTAEAPVER